MVVTIVSTELVRAKNCKDDELPKRIELTPYDLRHLQRVPIERGLLFIKPQSSDHHQTNKSFVNHLKNSLSSTLDIFFPLAGRLATLEHDDGDDDSKVRALSFFIDCNNEGAQLVHAVADHVTVADILEPMYLPSILHSFFPLKGIKNYQGVAHPLLGIQVTELDDGFFVGCNLNHSVADGSSFWKFLNSWSEISRQLRQKEDHIIISKPPVFDRSLLGADFPIRLPFTLKDYELGSFSFPPPSSPLGTSRFHFSKTKIAELKVRANVALNGNPTPTISSLQSLMGHVWRSMLRYQGVAEIEGEETTTTTLFIPVGTRSRFKVPLPEEYFRNAVDGRMVTLSVGEVLNEGYAALEINKVVASNTPDEVAKRFQSWVQNHTLSVPGGLPKNLFLLVGSPRVNVYGNDFGWGKPVAVRSRPKNQVGGAMAVFPGVEEGSIDIEICLSPESLKNLRMILTSTN